MQSLRDRMDKVASANVPVLIHGESGTGKDIIARMIHGLSPWRNGPFVKVNCPAIPGTLLESELFGYEKGAFTGAYGSKPGRVEMAHRGTLFLDEISELDLGLQSKLLQLLQDGQFCRIGAQEDKKVEVRVVCATNRVLEVGNRERHLPPGSVLSHQRGQSADAAVARAPRRYSGPGRVFPGVLQPQIQLPRPRLSGELMSALQKYHWPGNIRELENLIKRYVILGSEEVISSDLVAHQQEFSNPDINFDGPISLKTMTRQATRELERKVILKVLQAHHWNRKQAARALSISYRALLYKIRDAGLPPNRSSRRRTEPLPAQDVAAD